MKNIIVSAGHGSRDPGAVSGSTLEHLQTYPIAWLLRAELEAKGFACDFISCFQTLSEKIRDVNERHAIKPVDVAIEIHFNSAENSQAHGTECLFYSAKTESLATRISKSLSTAIGTFDRGAKRRTDLGWLKQTQCPALIVEVAFISNADDAAKMVSVDFSRKAAKGIAAGIT